jgi:monoterpene epsilon-lactone hydrolase
VLLPEYRLAPEHSITEMIEVYLQLHVFLFRHCSRLSLCLSRSLFGVGCRVGLPVFGHNPNHPNHFNYPNHPNHSNQANTLNISGGSIIVAGDGTGAALALSLLNVLHENHLKMPAAALLLSPYADLTLPLSDRRGDFVLRAQRLVEGRASFLKDDDKDDKMTTKPTTQTTTKKQQDELARNPAYSPALANLAGLPPLLVWAGGNELLEDSARALVKKVRAAGTGVEFSFSPHGFHRMHLFDGFLAEATAVCDELAAWVDSKFVEEPPEHGNTTTALHS